MWRLSLTKEARKAGFGDSSTIASLPFGNELFFLRGFAVLADQAISRMRAPDKGS